MVSRERCRTLDIKKVKTKDGASEVMISENNIALGMLGDNS